jgi:hypothetical protein
MSWISIIESGLLLFLLLLELNNIKLCDLKVHLNTQKYKCTSSEIPINLSFYVHMIPTKQI